MGGGEPAAFRLVAADRSKVYDQDVPAGASRAVVSYERWARGPFTIRLAELEKPDRVRGKISKAGGDHSRRFRLVAEGRIEPAKKRRR